MFDKQWCWEWRNSHTCDSPWKEGLDNQAEGKAGAVLPYGWHPNNLNKVVHTQGSGRELLQHEHQQGKEQWCQSNQKFSSQIPNLETHSDLSARRHQGCLSISNKESNSKQDSIIISWKEKKNVTYYNSLFFKKKFHLKIIYLYTCVSMWVNDTCMCRYTQKSGCPLSSSTYSCKESPP